MKFGSKKSVLILCGIFVTLLAVSFTRINSSYIFLAAGLAASLISFNGGWVNGVFMSLLFNFTFYSLHTAMGVQSMVLNIAVFSALSVLADRLKIGSNAPVQKDSNPEEKAFVNKVINSFMLGHDMVREIKKGITRSELLALFARNVSNLTGADQVLVYTGENAPEGKLKLTLSAGKYQERVIEPEAEIESVLCLSEKNLPANEAGFIKSVSDGYAIIMPVNEKGKAGDIAVLYKGNEFSYSDIYIAEFFSAQIFVIMEKQELLKKMSGNYERIIEALALAIDTKDHETHGHSLATMKYAVKIAEKMNLPDEEREMIKYASLLHDIGKINISSAILNKPDKLTAEEFDIIKKHPEEGVHILDRMDIFGEILPLVMHHHEHFDGKGYPKKLKGDSIPLGSRICSIADAYSVMVADRPYRKARTRDEAINELKRCSGTQFDRQIVDVFLGIIKEENTQEAALHNITGAGPVN